MRGSILVHSLPGLLKVLSPSTVFENFRDAELAVHIGTMAQFVPLFEELFKSGGSIVGKVVIDPHQ